MKTTGCTRDLSKVETPNSTKTLAEAYQDLMKINDATTLAKAAVEIIKTKGGISQSNWERFQINLMRALEKGLAEVRKYLTNYMLAGMGMSVSKYETRLRGR